MKSLGFMSAWIACAAVLGSAPANADTFAFQGKLQESDQPVIGPVNLAFRLHNDAIAGSQIGPELTLPAFNDFGDAGEFTVDLDFGSTAFPGADRWLEVWVDGAPLSPRQPVHPTPYAMHAQNATTASSVSPGAVPFNFSGPNAVFTGGSVGIGTGSPGASLDVVGEIRASGAGASFVALNPTNPSAIARFDWLNDVARVRIGGLGAGANNGFDIQGTSNASLLRVLGDGRVGIGTDAPEQLLHVKDGDAGVTPNANSLLVIERDNSVFVNVLAPDAVQSGLLFGNPAGGSAAGGVVFNSSATPQGLQFRTNGNSTKMVIQDDGDVGIGTTAPAARLHVNGDMRVDGAITIPTTTRYLTITADAFEVEDLDDLNHGNLGGAGHPRITVGAAFGLGINTDSSASVQLPHGAVVTEMAAFVDDFSTISNIAVSLRQANAFGGMSVADSIMALVASSGATGKQIRIDATISDATIDNQNRTYWVVAEFPAGTALNQLTLYAVRITYTVTTPMP